MVVGGGRGGRALATKQEKNEKKRESRK